LHFGHAAPGGTRLLPFLWFLDVKVNQARDICVIWFLLEDDIVFRRGACDLLGSDLQLFPGSGLGANDAFRIGLRQHGARSLDALSPASFPATWRGTPTDFDNRLNHRRMLRTACRTHDRIPQEVVEADLASVTYTLGAAGCLVG
jgi:hypothetical protein